MSEWMPVLLGAVLGAMHRRFAWSRRTLILAALVAGAVATIVSGEWVYAPYLIIADVLLVFAGVVASRAAYRAWATYAARRIT